MKRFSEYLAEAKAGRKKGGKNNPFRKDDIEFLTSRGEKVSSSSSAASIKIGKVRDRLVKSIMAKDAKLLDGQMKSLRELQKIADTYDIDVNPPRQKKWAKKEQDIANGVNEFIRSGIIRVVNPDGSLKRVLTDNRFMEAKTVGGGLSSDVKVTWLKLGKGFFIESKLNFETSEYFKFGLQIDGDRITYDHSRLLQGLDPEADAKQLKFINMIFGERRDLDRIINFFANTNPVKKTWRKFLDNIESVRKFIRQSAEYADFASELELGTKFPVGFSNITRVFDLYSSFYVDRYNELIDKMFDLITDEELLKSKRLYRIRSRKQDVKAETDPVFESIAQLKTIAAGKVSDQVKFDEYASEIQLIERKFLFMLETLKRKGRQVDFNSIPDMTNEEKLKYFFKMFISATGRLTKDNALQLLRKHDVFGNMQLCKIMVFNVNLMSRLIKNYYLSLHHCAYIQVDNIVFQVQEGLNPLGINNLPIFEEMKMTYVVKLLISDDLSKIMLHMRAIKPDAQKFAGKTIVSFDKNDKNYVCNSLKSAEIRLKA